MTIKSYKELSSLFVPAKRTPAGINFGNPPKPCKFEDAKVIVYGVPFDDTATFGKGSDRGPEAIRHTSANQIETYCLDRDREVYDKTPVFDLGDLKIKNRLTPKEIELLHEGGEGVNRNKALAKLELVLDQFEVLKDITQFIRSQGKIPLMLGGEHTLSYWPLSALRAEKPVVIHFDAHRDAKREYLGMSICHTTPMHKYLVEKEKGNPADFVQIGIRQTDREENDFANKVGIKTFYPRDVKKNLESVRRSINKITNGRKVYVTFDIDALDICYTPCTGTPEPFGLNPQEIVSLVRSINKNSQLIGADFVEVAVKNEDFREGTIATQILLRLILEDFVR